MKQPFLIIIFLIIILVLLTIILYGCNGEKTGSVVSSGDKIILYKSPACGCCANYAAELKKQGFNVEVVSVPDMSDIKERYNIPMSMNSCHTTVIGDYFVEGHMPIEAIEKLLQEKPAIDGIALPGMPAGSPGMPGSKTAPFRIYAVSDSQISEFTVI